MLFPEATHILQHHMSVELHHHGVPADRIVCLECLAVPEAVARCEQLDVVAVKVHWVHVLDNEWVVDHDADGPVGTEIVHPALLAKLLRRTSCLRVAKNRVAVVAFVELAA